MIFYGCKSLISQTFQKPLNLYKTNGSVRLFVLFYSSSKEIPTESTNAILNLLHKHEFSPKTASKVASSISRLKNTEKCESILTFLKDAGFSAAQLEKMVKKKPALLASNLDKTIKCKLKLFEDFGFSKSDIADIFCADPAILSRSALNRIVPSIMSLNKVLGSISKVAELLKVSGTFLKRDLDKTMLPNIEYLKSCGIETEQIVKLVYSFPRFILHKPENMKKYVEKADEMGCARNSNMFIHSIRTLSSMREESWKQKLELFRDVGFSEEQILLTFQKKPQVFAISCTKIQKTVTLILDSEKFDMSDVYNNPQIFICSVEKTLKPRLHVLDILESRKLLKKQPSFYVLHNVSKQKFFNRYVFPYLGEVGEFKSLDDWRRDVSKLDILGAL